MGLRRAILGLLCAAASLLTFASPASALVLGTGWSGEPNHIVPEMFEVGKSGSQVFRVPITENWAGNDAAVEAAALSGVTIHAGLGGGGALPGAGAPTNAWLSWVSTAVTKYGYGGTFWEQHPSLPYKPITTWEIWNEPDLSNIPPLDFGQFVSDNANAIQAASHAQGGRGTEVLSGGLFVWGIKEAMQDRQVYLGTAYGKFATNANVTGVAIHPYELDPNSFIPGYNRIQAFEFAVQSFHNTLVSLAGAANAPQKTLWITETGWPAEAGSNAGESFSVGPTEQANLLRQSITFAKNNQAALNLGGYIWYNFRDRPFTVKWDDYCGLKDHNGGFRPSWTAFQEMAGVPLWTPAPPDAETAAATNIQENQVTFNASVNPRGAPTTYRFEYGQTTNYGNSVPLPEGSAGAGIGSVNVATTLNVLPRTRYHYRIVATNRYGTDYGADRAFTTGVKWLVRNANSGGNPDLTFWFGLPGETRVSGDWNGDGVDTPGVYNSTTGVWKLRDSNTTGAAGPTFQFGGPVFKPVVGDWNNDGIDTVGLYDPATGNWVLHSTNAAAGSNITFQFGGPVFSPVVGDWNNDGTDTVGLYDPATGNWVLHSANAAAGSNITFQFGGSQFKPVAGDWNGDGTDTVGLFEPTPGNWILHSTNAAAGTNTTFQYGGSQFQFNVGDWDGNGTDTPALSDANAGTAIDWLLRNSNNGGGPDLSPEFGTIDQSPVAGDWNNDGTDTIGRYEPQTGMWALRDSNTTAAGGPSFQFGGSQFKPVVGDWNGDGVDTAGLYEPATGNWVLHSTNAAAGTNITFQFGGSQFKPVVGDWNNDGIDTVGLYEPSTGNWVLHSTNAAAGTNITFQFGGPVFSPVVGDWNKDGIDTVGLYDPATGNWVLHSTNAAAGSNTTFQYGGSQFKPVVGDWNNDGTDTVGLVRW